MKQAKRRTISFRIPKDIEKLLEMKAEEYEMTENSYARHLFMQGLLGESYLLQEILERQEEIREGQEMQETNLKTATVALLVDAGKASVTEAEGFVRERFRKAGRSESRSNQGQSPKTGAGR